MLSNRINLEFNLNLNQMKTKALILIHAGLFIATLATLSSCNKDKEADAILDASRSNSTAESLFTDLLNQVQTAYEAQEDEVSGGKRSQELFDGCPTLTLTPFDTINWPKVLMVDFGNIGCQGSDGRIRKGKIVAELTGRYRAQGTVVTINLEEYYVNGNHVEGTKVITNEGYQSDEHLTFSILVQNAKITKPDGDVITWSSQRQRVWVEGEGTPWPNFADDIYEVTGSAQGTGAAGYDFEMNITQALRVELDCDWITTGTIDIIPEGVPVRLLDFGDGTCDNYATVTIEGKSYEILLP